MGASTDERAVTLSKGSAEEREARIAAASTPLPGAAPYLNQRRIHVPARCDGIALIDFLESLKSHLSRQEWLAAAAARQLRRRELPLGAEAVVRAGDCILHLIPNTVEPEVNAAIKVVQEDASLFVVDKPCPLPVHPGGRFNRNTALYILERALPELSLRPVHRLDANTTGLLIFAKSKEAARTMARQFEQRSIQKDYLVKAEGHPAKDHFQCDLPIQRAPAEAGTRSVDRAGLPALTHFSVLARLADGTSLLLARPESGRTNQIRLHLQQLGHPVCGEQAYGDGADLSRGLCQQGLLCLHAWKVRFRHPTSGAEVELCTELPGWAPVNLIGAGA